MAEPLFPGADVSGRTFVLIDFDGTLGDTSKSLYDLHHAALLAFGIAEEDLSDIHRLMGPPAPAGFFDNYPYEYTDENVERLNAAYAKATEQLGAEQAELYPGIAEACARLRAAGKRLVVASSRTADQVEALLKQNDALEWFDAICGQYDPTISDKVAIVAHALEELGCTADEAVMVGDRFYDVVGAHGNNMPCVGVLWGQGGAEELGEAGCDLYVETAEELADLLIGG